MSTPSKDAIEAAKKMRKAGAIHAFTEQSYVESIIQDAIEETLAEVCSMPLTPDERESINEFYLSHFSEQQQEWTPSKHHPSCTPNDRDLIWLCSQCGGHESAEEWHNAALADEREISKEWFDRWGDTKQQLATLDDKWRDRFKKFGKIVMKEKEEALAAERESHEKRDEVHWKTRRTLLRIITQLEQQLAAAVEALEVIAENADHYADDYTETESLRIELRGFAETARAALAKCQQKSNP